MRIRIAISTLILAMSASAHASYRISVWQPRTEVARDRVRQHAGIITETNPVFYTMTTNGALVESSKAYNTTWTSALAGTEIIPTFQNTVDYTYWGGTEVANYVIHPNYRDAYTTQIVDKVQLRGWAGADIDYEGVPSTSRDDFSAFIALLAQKLHAVNKKLSVCVYAKTSDVASWDAPNGQDWAAIGQHADYVKIMIYGSHSTQKPNSTFLYINSVINYAKSRISDHKKIIVGMPWYAQEYKDYNLDGKYEDYDSYGYDQVAAFLQANPHITPVRDTANSGEMNFSYTSNGVPTSVWYTDGPAWAAKVQYVIKNHPTVGGFAQWSIGEEDPKVWGSVAQLKPRWEFNKDGNHDVVHRSTSGQIALWNMSSNTIVNNTLVGTDANFDVVAAGHFMRDGETELLLRNHATGEMKVWWMNNHTVIATYVLPTTTDLNWKVVGVADLDADGRHEIIWHHQTTGGTAYWRRNLGDNTWSGYTLGPAMAPASWQMAGVGDFNLDGHDDLLWRNQSNGDNVLWTVVNGTVTNNGGITHAPLPWKIAGVGDFNRDHYPDILWRNETTWETAIWQMKDRTLLGSGNTAQADPAYKVVRVGDFNGDGFFDILWRHSSGGDIIIWQMNGYAANSLYVAAPGAQWNVTAK